MTFQRLFLIFLLFIATTLGFLFASVLAFPDPAWPLDKGERITLTPGTTLTQTFTSSRNGLRQIEILFGKFTLQEKDSLTLELRDRTCSTLLAQTTLAQRSFDSEHTYAFTFDRIPDSRDQTYCFVVSYATDRSVEKTKAPRLYHDLSAQTSPYTLGDKGVNTKGASPIALRPGYQPASTLATFGELTDRMSQYKPSFLKDGVLVTLAVFGLVLTFLVLILLVREDRDSEV